MRLPYQEWSATRNVFCARDKQCFFQPWAFFLQGYILNVTLFRKHTEMESWCAAVSMNHYVSSSNSLTVDSKTAVYILQCLCIDIMASNLLIKLCTEQYISFLWIITLLNLPCIIYLFSADPHRKCIVSYCHTSLKVFCLFFFFFTLSISFFRLLSSISLLLFLVISGSQKLIGWQI